MFGIYGWWGVFGFIIICYIAWLMHKDDRV